MTDFTIYTTRCTIWVLFRGLVHFLVTEGKRIALALPLPQVGLQYLLAKFILGLHLVPRRLHMLLLSVQCLTRETILCVQRKIVLTSLSYHRRYLLPFAIGGYVFPYSNHHEGTHSYSLRTLEILRNTIGDKDLETWS